MVNTSTLVAYQGKPVSRPSERIPQGKTFDHVLIVYNSASDNKSRLKLSETNVLPPKNKDFLYLTNIKKDDICGQHLTELG